jgi:predicted Ser/Thr protein kinase
MITPADRRIGKYEIRRKLGRGGMADVYLAEDTETGRAVALKLIEHSADPDSIETIEAERRGAELQARLAGVDRRVVRVYDAGELEHYFHVAMEYVDGEDLAELLRAGPIEVDFAVDTAIAVAETLDNAHNLEASIDGKVFRGVVHGDIKPKNIRIDGRGEVRVLDFGIAKTLSASRKLTRNEFGSVPYASPERLDSGQVNALSDLWSLAVMLYEMVTGVLPYRAETTERLESMIRSRIPPPPAPDPCPEPLRRILMKATAPEAGARYQTARAFAGDLIAFREGAPVAAATEDLDATRRTARAGMDDATRRTAPADAETRREPMVRNWPRAGQAPAHCVCQGHARGGGAGWIGADLWRVGPAFQLPDVPARAAAQARHTGRAGDRSRNRLDALDGTFQAQSFVSPPVRAAQGGEGDAGGGSRPRD